MTRIIMKLAIAQIDLTVGNLEGNAAKILDTVHQARDAGARLVVTPELALSGYPPEDLLLRDGFELACREALANLAIKIKGVTLVIGHPHRVDHKLYNAASVIHDGGIIATYLKSSLPNDSVFDERRYFEPGSDPCIFELSGIKFGIQICQDIWQGNSARRTREAGANALLVLNASPYHMRKQALRYQAARQQADEIGIPIIYANLVGAQDELLFDGASFAIDAEGKLTHQFPAFRESLGLIDLQNGVPVPVEIAAPPSLEAEIYQALCLGLKTYIEKNHLPGVLLGLSGGVDSALVMAIAVDALGADKVEAIMMPSRFTADISLWDARAMAKTLNVRYSEISIEPVFTQFLETLGNKLLGRHATATTQENLQARIRGNMLMALSNKSGAIVLTTGNKSETAVGYCTLYGDMAGGFSVLKDISKTMVYRLCRYRNSLGKAIPERVITRPPSAELRPGQTDQDSLPPYDVLDGIVEAYMERDLSLQEILDMDYAEADVRRVINLIRQNEYKRRQSAPGPRITKRAFGKDWRYPITASYQDEF
jgi:NAD+ synthase (glutamine-hydrolysing)